VAIMMHSEECKTNNTIDSIASMPLIKGGDSAIGEEEQQDSINIHLVTTDDDLIVSTASCSTQPLSLSSLVVKDSLTSSSNVALSSSSSLSPSSSSYHPSIMFCGECTTCTPAGTSPPILSSTPLGTTLTHVPMKRKNVSKMFFIPSNNVEIITSDDDMEKDLEGGTVSGRKEKQTCSLYVANLSQQSQLLLISKVLNSTVGVLEFKHYWDSSDNVEKNNDNDEKKKYLDVFYDPLTLSLDKLLHSLQSMNLDVSLKQENRSIIRNEEESCTLTRKPVRSSMHVEGICCASEVPQVTSILRNLSGTGVDKVRINITSRMVYVDHFPDEIGANDLAAALNKEGFGATVKKNGGGGAGGRVPAEKDNGHQTCTRFEMEQDKNMSSSRTSLFVASTLLCPSLTTVEEMQVVQDLLLEQSSRLPRKSVRVVSPNLASRSIKIQHDPNLVSGQDLANVLMDVGGFENITVLVDGKHEGLFLPSMNDDLDTRELNLSGFQSKYNICHHLLPKGLGINIVISGIFWCVSLVGHFRPSLDYLKYFGLISVAFGIPSVAKKAFRTLKRRHFDANCMMVTAAIGSVCLQEYDEAASVSFLFAISEYLEEQATKRATKALDSIINMRPDHANLILDEKKDDIIIVPVNDLKIGDLVSVRTGDQIPSDGVVVEGSSQIDESSLTGESTLLTKQPGDAVSGGTINAGMSPLKIRIVSLVEDSAVSRLVRLVEESASNRSPTEQIVDAFAKSYTPTVIVIAILMCTVPWFINVDAGKQWMLNGLILVVIACPCALTISTPVTYAAGLAATAQKGIIVKGGAKLEALGSVKTVMFDKTGTLTEGKFRLNELEVVGTKKSRREVLSLLAIMEAPSSHPLAATLVNAAKAEGIQKPTNVEVLNHSILQGEGVTALVDGERVYVGNESLFQRLDMYSRLDSDLKEKANLWNEKGGTIGYLGILSVGIVGMFCVSDGVRPEARNVVTSLINTGLKVMMLTGDGDGAARAVAKEVGLPIDCVQSRLTPDAKLHCVASELGLSKRKSTLFSKKRLLLFVGDGVNGKCPEQ
jgi:ATPase, P-type (transporting), HAD superfamily, subfamily IC/heavy metal translocating P-type ATPase